jgi:hypothetical protein
MTRIELKSRIGPDGTLTLKLPVGVAEANREVLVTVEPVDETGRSPVLDPKQWRRFVEETAGSIADATFTVSKI